MYTCRGTTIYNQQTITAIVWMRTSDAEGDLRDDAEDREGEWGCEAYDLSDGNVYEGYADSLVAQVEIGGYERSNPSPTAHLVLSSS
jgi:hypothetical protein